MNLLKSNVNLYFYDFVSIHFTQGPRHHKYVFCIFPVQGSPGDGGWSGDSVEQAEQCPLPVPRQWSVHAHTPPSALSWAVQRALEQWSSGAACPGLVSVVTLTCDQHCSTPETRWPWSGVKKLLDYSPNRFKLIKLHFRAKLFDCYEVKVTDTFERRKSEIWRDDDVLVLI